MVYKSSINQQKNIKNM